MWYCSLVAAARCFTRPLRDQIKAIRIIALTGVREAAVPAASVHKAFVRRLVTGRGVNSDCNVLVKRILAIQVVKS